MAPRFMLLVLGSMATACTRAAPTPESPAREPAAAESTPPAPVVVGDRRRVGGPNPVPVPGAKLTLIDYFATWCGSSERWVYVVEAMKQRYGPAGLSVVAVPNVDESSVADLEAFLRARGATFPLAPDADKRIQHTFRPSGFGQAIIGVDADGIVRLVHRGTREGDFESVDRRVAALLAEKK